MAERRPTICNLNNVINVTKHAKNTIFGVPFRDADRLSP